MANIIIYYNKKQIHTGKLITVRVGKASIHCRKLTLNNISGDIIYKSRSRGRAIVKTLGITTPLVIPILSIPTKRALKERARYRKNHG